MSRTSNRPVDWEMLVTHNETRLYRAALAILGDPHEAEDAGGRQPSSWAISLVEYPS